MKNLSISDETYDLIKDQLGVSEKIDINGLQDFVGKKLFIRTVTYHLVGEVVKIVGNLFELKNASWIADSGRFKQAIDDGVLNEVEPVKVPVFVNINSITDMFIWTHKLPREQK
jgi:hypothetical protein